jgi:hypothetical protein
VAVLTTGVGKVKDVSMYALLIWDSRKELVTWWDIHESQQPTASLGISENCAGRGITVAVGKGACVGGRVGGGGSSVVSSTGKRSCRCGR